MFLYHTLIVFGLLAGILSFEVIRGFLADNNEARLEHGRSLQAFLPQNVMNMSYIIPKAAYARRARSKNLLTLRTK